MNTIKEYILQTKSAVTKIYEAFYSYSELMEYPESPVFNYWGDFHSQENQQAYSKWLDENEDILKERNIRDDEFAYSYFARSNLCGSILQYAYMAIKLFSENENIPIDLEKLVIKYKAKKFCIGRNISNLPMGLIIYAGRNQAMHYDSGNLNELNTEIFNRLANYYSKRFQKWFVDSNYDLKNDNIIHYSENIIYKLEWYNYERYEKDIIQMLGVIA